MTDYWSARFQYAGTIGAHDGDPVDLAAELGTLWRYRNPDARFELRMELDPISFAPTGRGWVLDEDTGSVIDRFTMRRIGSRAA